MSEAAEAGGATRASASGASSVTTSSAGASGADPAVAGIGAPVSDEALEALRVRVTGVVQGVGFRPFVYRVAQAHGVKGWVLNAVDGVTIHAEGSPAALDALVIDVAEHPPAAAQVQRVTMDEVPVEGFADFSIVMSDAAAEDEVTLVSPDLATCDDCARELLDPADRRHRYPFINCTNCGPRFTIINGLPYDRPKTSMERFPLCPVCAHEYADPLDRRFHAQPNACFACGPHLEWRSLDGQAAGPVQVARTRADSDRLISQAVSLMAQGGIVAVKGLGGFHLMCDAADEGALARLRQRKKRDGKAFAVLVATADEARTWCEVSPEERRLLESPARPIVLLRKRAGAALARGLVDDLPELGVMLPATPLQHLLLADFREATGRGMLVATSGNVHDDPIVADDGEAAVRLAPIADALLGHDRAIVSRYDDSVARVIAVPGVDQAGGSLHAVQFIRRARGYAPFPVKAGLVAPGAGEGALDSGTEAELESAAVPAPTSAPAPACESPSASESARCVLGTGSEQKNTLCLSRGGEMFVSQHIGDVESVETYDAWLEAKARYERLFKLSPTHVACDLHPEYLVSKWARDQRLPVIEVQHHHAHIASVLGEHGIAGPVCGVAFDGTGYGPDGALWGGEVLVANQADYERFANFSYVPLPGGAAAIRNPLRTALGALWAFDLLDHPGAATALRQLGDQAPVLLGMIEQGLNCPQTSSVGRLFDAASALCGVCVRPSYEGEAAILLDAARAGFDRFDPDERYRVAIRKNAALPQSTAHDTSVVMLDAAPTFRALLDDLVADVPVAVVSARFHGALVQAVADVAELVRAAYGIDQVALSGGSFMNRFLIENCLDQLGQRGFTVAVNADLPPNDGCISYGQAVVASARG
ncbi:hydrogenase maturation protein HypF [Eggerthellaceae bacterium zg-1084]|uniref:carbamoyltransferase HypF n=1 Tax=Berryella wangjianweii TaxID=2734634 RepID=UPI001557E468|nr:carbamoyltransferase HypF [Berryella wangjianweii]NPD31091.1 hydrogenase maturation protein HypF [Berryella wangjianweii]